MWDVCRRRMWREIHSLLDWSPVTSCLVNTDTNSFSKCNYFQHKRWYSFLLPPASAVEVIESQPFVCVCLCVCLSALSRLNRLTYDLDIAPFCLLCICVCVSQFITKKGLLGKRTVQWGNAGGTWMLLKAFSFLCVFIRRFSEGHIVNLSENSQQWYSGCQKFVNLTSLGCQSDKF